MNATSCFDLTSRMIGRWFVLGPAERGPDGRRRWRCRCGCGITKIVSGKNLRARTSTQCRGCAHRKHGALNGRRCPPEYTIWVSMIGRCHNPKNRAFTNYGGRGIAVCDRWRESFAVFMEDMGPRPSDAHEIDRFPDNDGGYEPGNCRWATSKQQNRNRRNNRIIEAFGERLCVAEWAERFGVDRALIKDRLRRGWPAERAICAAKRGAA